MKKFANKTFFKFLFGFISILVISFVIIFATGCYQGGDTLASCAVDIVNNDA